MTRVSNIHISLYRIIEFGIECCTVEIVIDADSNASYPRAKWENTMLRPGYKVWDEKLLWQSLLFAILKNFLVGDKCI